MRIERELSGIEAELRESEVRRINSHKLDPFHPAEVEYLADMDRKAIETRTGYDGLRSKAGELDNEKHRIAQEQKACRIKYSVMYGRYYGEVLHYRSSEYNRPQEIRAIVGDRPIVASPSHPWDLMEQHQQGMGFVERLFDTTFNPYYYGGASGFDLGMKMIWGGTGGGPLWKDSTVPNFNVPTPAPYTSPPPDTPPPLFRP